MRICVVVANQPMRWQLCVSEVLVKSGCDDVVVRRSNRGPTVPSALHLLLAFERLVYHRGGEDLVRTAENEPIPTLAEAAPAGPFDLVITLAGDLDEGPAAARRLAPHFDGAASEMGAVGALVDRRAFSIGVIETTAEGRRRRDYPAALDDSSIISTSLANVCSRAVDLLMVQAFGMAGDANPDAAGGVVAAGGNVGSLAIGVHGVRTFESKLRKRLTTLASGTERWAIGWRELQGSVPIVSGDAATARYQILPDDGQRYFADPFLFEHDGQTFIFCEEFPFATGKGMLSVFVRAAHGGFQFQQTILEGADHLSYPQVFADGGQIWMIPESGASGRVDLYRADPFPVRWVREATLIEGVRAYDATLHRDQSGYWMFLTSALLHSSPSDRLSLYHAASLLGPWRRCEADPILIDATCARPGGRMFHADGALHRVAQDCSRIYGGALSVHRISSLSAAGVTQTCVGRLAAKDSSRFSGLHTYDRNARLEVIDVFGYPDGQPAVDVCFVPHPSGAATCSRA